MPSAYELATTHAGVIPLAHWSTLEVSGRDRATFLNNMCTNDIRSLLTGQGCEAFFTDVKGKTIGHGFFLVGAESICVLMVPGLAARLIPHLDRYIIREDVTLADRSADLDWRLLVGAKPAQVVDRLAPRAGAGVTTNWSHERRPCGSAAVHWVQCPLPWCGGILAGTSPPDATAVDRAVADAGAIPCDDEIWQTVRVESAWPLFGVDFDSDNLPQEVARDRQAISFRKGCYLGQETVARIDAIGHVNQQLVAVRFASDEPPPTGSELLADGKPVGRVTSASRSPRLGAAIGLSMLRRSAASEGTRLNCQGIEVEVIRTPAVGESAHN